MERTRRDLTKCRICDASIEPFIDFGRMPISNGFLGPESFASEYFYRMRVAVCAGCATLQLLDVPDPGQMYHDQYAYFASTSRVMREHFSAMAKDLIRRFVSTDVPFVVEIGSNDGITLRNFARVGIPHLGVEPSANVAEVARKQGISVIVDFFSLDAAKRIVANYGHADLFIATNTMHNIEDINSVASGIAHLLKPKGIMVQEDPYLGSLIENTAYDQLYAEHVYIWSIASLANAFGRHGLRIFDVEPNEMHGGCMRYFLCKEGAHAPTSRLETYIEREKALGLTDPLTFDRFRQATETSRDRLVDIVRHKKKAGKRVVGYGATAKSTTILNYCKLGPDDIEYISDTTSLKQGKYTPGTHIPIVSPDAFADRYPDFAILFAWNHFEEIEATERAFRINGGKWIIPIRKVQIV